MICFLVSKTKRNRKERESYLARKESALHHFVSVFFGGSFCMMKCFVWKCKCVCVIVFVCVCVCLILTACSPFHPFTHKCFIIGFPDFHGLHPICNFNTIPRLLLLLFFLLPLFFLHRKNCVCMCVCVCVCVCLLFIC